MKYIGGKVRDVHNPSLAIAFARAEAVANEYHDGHFVLMKFTTNWRFCFGTPALDHVTIADETFVGHTAEEAIERAIEQEPLLVSGKVVAASDALLESIGTVQLEKRQEERLRPPGLGDIVTWWREDAGWQASGIVVTLYSMSVLVAVDHGAGQIGYEQIGNDKICKIQRKRDVNP